MEETTNVNKKNNKILILFDIDDTLFDSTGFRKIARKKAISDLKLALDKYGYKFSFGFLYDEFDKVYQDNKNSNKIFDKLLAKIDISNQEIPMLVAIALDSYYSVKEEMKTMPFTVETLEYLKNKGYTLGIVSEGLSIKQWDKLIQIGIYEFFEPKFVFITESFNKILKDNCKKDILFYNLVKKQLSEHNFNQKFVIGDKFLSDFKPAHGCGFECILVDSPNLKEGDKKKINNAGGKFVKNLKELFEIF
jgi:putative hydrolase of the HAD superfamily